jgi:hypothetical protein
MKYYCALISCCQCIFSMNYPDDCPTGSHYHLRGEECPHLRLAEVDDAGRVIRVLTAEESQLLML